MHRSIRRAAVGVAACVIVSTAAGCSTDEEEARNLVECAGIVFPAEMDARWSWSDNAFREATSAAVVDIPADAVGEFRRLSGFSRFEPGVPPSWQPYWRDSGVADVLSVETGNEHSIDEYRDPRRYVVIHDGGGETRRIFVRTDC